MAVKGKDYLWISRLQRDMLAKVAQKINGNSLISFGEHEINLGKWDEVNLNDYLKTEYGKDLQELDSDKCLKEFCEKHHVKLPNLNSKLKEHMLRAVLFDAVFEQKVVPQFKKPTFFMEVPWYLAGPAQLHPLNKSVKLRGEGYAGQMELINSKNITTNYQYLKKWHESIADYKKEAGFGEYATIDKGYLETISYGLQPGACASMGLDRLVMLILGKKNIKEVIMYPLISDNHQYKNKCKEVKNG